MNTIASYSKAIKLCEALEDAGLVSLQMPERNIFISDKVGQADRACVIEAIGIYVRVYNNLKLATVALKLMCAVMVISLCASALL